MIYHFGKTMYKIHPTYDSLNFNKEKCAKNLFVEISDVQKRMTSSCDEKKSSTFTCTMYCIFVRLLHGKNFFTHNCKFNLIGCNLLFTFYVTHSEFITYSTLYT